MKIEMHINGKKKERKLKGMKEGGCNIDNLRKMKKNIEYIIYL